MLCLHWFNIPAIFLFQADFSIYLFVFNIHTSSERLSHLFRCTNLEFSKCKQKHDTSLVYITKTCKLCFSLITLRLTLKFRLIIRNALTKIKFSRDRGQNCDRASLSKSKNTNSVLKKVAQDNNPKQRFPFLVVMNGNS